MQFKFIANLAISCVLATVVAAQAPSPAPQPPRRVHGSGAPGTSPVATSTVPMEQPVITLKGGCQPVGNIQPAPNCTATVTRAEFEKLVNALQPDMPPESRRNFATNYGRLLVFSDLARALHLENDPNTQAILQFMTMRVLADAVSRHYTEEYAHPSEQQIQAYYTQNSAKFRESVLERLIIPINQGSTDKPKPPEAEQKAAAEKLRQRWVAGEDPAKLQQAAYEAIGVMGAGTPDVGMGARRPGSLPVNQEAVFQLKAGEVSELYSDQAAYYVFKVVSVRDIPLSEVKDQISNTLQQQQLQDKLEEISKSATPVLNEEYFGPAPAGPPMPHAPATGAAPAPSSGPK